MFSLSGTDRAMPSSRGRGIQRLRKANEERTGQQPEGGGPTIQLSAIQGKALWVEGQPAQWPRIGRAFLILEAGWRPVCCPEIKDDQRHGQG